MRLIFLLILFSNQVVFAQVFLPQLLDVKKMTPVFIEFGAGKKKEHSSFRSFKIEDNRVDKQTCGYIRFTQEYKKFQRLEWRDGAKSPEEFLNNYFFSNSAADSSQLVIRLKNFFITQDYLSPGENISLTNVIYQSKVFVTADLVVKQNQSTYFLRNVDTVITLKKWLGKAYNQIAEMAFQMLVWEAEETVKSKLLAKADNSTDKTTLRFSSAFTQKNGFYYSYQDFLEQQPSAVNYRLEQRKRVVIAFPMQDADSLILKNSWGFMNEGTLYVRKNRHYIPLQENLGSWSGIGIAFSEVAKTPVAGAIIGNPLMFAADMADLAINSTVAKLTHYCLYRLNFENGQLE